jgi:hypothetical protein
MSMQTVRPGKTPGTAGLRTVVYRDTAGKTHEAQVISAGTGSGLKLRLVNIRTPGSRTAQIRDNVLPATAMRGAGSTDRYFRAWSPTQTLA